MERSFKVQDENKKEIELTVVIPRLEEREKAKLKYSSKVSELIRDKDRNQLLTREELEGFLKEKGIWTEKDERAVQKLHDEIAEIHEKLREGGISILKGREFAIEAAKKRREITEIQSKRREFDDATIQAVAEDEFRDYLVFLCTKDEQGEQHWPTFEDLKLDRDSQAYNKATEIMIYTIYDVDPDYEKRIPENKWLLKYGFLDEDLFFVNRKTKERVDEKYQPLADRLERAKKTVMAYAGDLDPEKPFIEDDADDYEEKSAEEKPKKRGRKTKATVEA